MVNDISHSSSLLSFILFADDNNIFLSGKDIPLMFSTINIELNNVYKWCNANKLTIHPDKTKYMVFHPSRRKPELDNLNVTIHGHDVESVQQTKYLGITLHQNLSWTAHINAINS